MSKKNKKDGYPWKFKSVGGTVRVDIRSGKDIAHLGELDRKMWTVLSCPVTGLEFDQKTLGLIDRDADGKIRVDEVIATAKWLTGILADPDVLLKEQDSLAFSDFNTDNPDGARLLASARQILANLGLEKEEISLEDTADNTRIFAGTPFNGDGIITALSTDDEALKALIGQIAGVGSATDRSGEPGITADHIEAFYAAAADYAAWKAAGTDDVFPFGDKTADALAACEALKDKIADYFMRCKLISFDEEAAGAVGISVDKIGGIAGNLALAADQIGEEPLAKPSADGVLPLKDGINPAWKAAVDGMAALVLPEGKESLTEAEWTEVLAKFAPYTAWCGAKKGAEVEGLGLDVVKAILADDKKAALLELVEKDKALEAEALSIEEVDKLLRLNKNFYRFLNNYVVLADFYDKDHKAVFQAGRLYIDQRSTDLCIRVAGPSPEISSLSGMYILYCACTSEKLGKTMNIAAVLTDGDVDGLRPGKNAIFYDRDGNDYTATVTSIVDNPISVRQAFWSPYKKVARWINDKIDKGAAEKNEKSLANLTSATDKATAGAPDPKNPAAAVTSTFDIAKFAGIFAAIGMALGFIGQFVVALVKGIAAIKFWQLLLIIVAIMLVISGPAMFIAWRKLRRRDLGPVLNANGWAINAKSLVSVKFGKTLTSLAKFPKLTAVDPEARRKARWRTFWICLVTAVLLCCGFLFFTDRLACIGLPFHKAEPEVEVVEEAAPAEAEAHVEAAEAAPAE